ncbi:MAG: hypothetical protein ACO3PD_08940 [Acidimicrobiales bacterium]
MIEISGEDHLAGPSSACHEELAHGMTPLDLITAEVRTSTPLIG